MINLGFGVLCGFFGVGFFGGAALVLWEFFLFVFSLVEFGGFFSVVVWLGFFCHWQAITASCFSRTYML